MGVSNSLTGKTIILVDDDLFFSRTLINCLTEQGATVRQFNTAERALDYFIKKKAHDVIIIDQLMGKIEEDNVSKNCCRLIQTIRSLGIDSPIVVLSGWDLFPEIKDKSINFCHKRTQTNKIIKFICELIGGFET